MRRVSLSHACLYRPSQAAALVLRAAAFQQRRFTAVDAGTGAAAGASATAGVPRATPALAAIQALRGRTDAPIAECRRALLETNGDEEAAVAWLRKTGAAKAVKKAGRATENGVVVACVAPGGAGAVVLSVATETDFAARNARLHAFAAAAASAAARRLAAGGAGLFDSAADSTAVAASADFDAAHAARLEEFLAAVQGDAEEARRAAVAVLGENVVVRSVDCPPPLTAAQREALAAPSGGSASAEASTSTSAGGARAVWGSYVHNSFPDFPMVGLIAAVVALQPRAVAAKDGAAAPPTPAVASAAEGSDAAASAAADDVAQHCVANFSNTQALSHQPFLGSGGDETCGQFLKRRGLALRCGVVARVGESPVFHAPPAGRPAAASAPAQ